MQVQMKNLMRNEPVYGKNIGSMHDHYQNPNMQHNDTTSWLKQARTPEPKPWMQGHSVPAHNAGPGPAKPFNE